jgi:hypothetical protein
MKKNGLCVIVFVAELMLAGCCHNYQRFQRAEDFGTGIAFDTKTGTYCYATPSRARPNDIPFCKDLK